VYPQAKTVAVLDQPTDEPSRILTDVESIDGASVLPGFSMTLSDIFKVSDFE